MTQADPGGPGAADDPAAHGRSGTDAADAVRTAASGTAHSGVQTAPEHAHPHTAPVEQVRDDPAMTQGRRVVTGDAAAADPPPEGADPAEAGPGGAQSVVGARVSDRVSAGQPPPGGPPFDED